MYVYYWVLIYRFVYLGLNILVSFLSIILFCFFFDYLKYLMYYYMFFSLFGSFLRGNLFFIKIIMYFWNWLWIVWVIVVWILMEDCLMFKKFLFMINNIFLYLLIWFIIFFNIVWFLEIFLFRYGFMFKFFNIG